jgi:G3E family GTPase
MTAAADPATIPVTLLTGFLGAGKTTLLNRVLSEAHGQRIAVVVNEFGEIGVDGAMIEGADGDVVELANGCLCCATRGQLLGAIASVMARGAPLDGIVIETSGLADPFPVLSELAHSSLSEALHVDGVITLVDAENFDRNLGSAEAAFQQIVAADLLLVNKVDLVGADIPGMIERGVRVLNPAARVIACTGADVPLAMVLGSRLGARDAAPASRPGDGTSHHHHDQGHGGFESLALEPHGALDPARLSDWLSRLPSNVFRAKGLVHLAGAKEQVVVSAVGTRHGVGPARPGAGPDRLVVIGRDLDAPALVAGLKGCHA